MDIVVIGSLNMDTKIEVPHIPLTGETILASNLSYNIGGKGTNQAVAIARLGSDIAMIGAVGNDESGKQIKDALIEENIDISGLMNKEAPTGCAFVCVDTSGNNNIVVYPGSNYEITEKDIENQYPLIKKAKICVMQLEIPFKIVFKVLKFCKENKIITILNPAPVVEDFDLECLKYVDYLMPNEGELAMLLQKEDQDKSIEEMANILIKKGCKNVIATLGDKGSALYNNEESYEVSIEPVKVVDTTAAGDSYIGAFSHCLSKGKTPKEAMKYATKVSALTVSRAGAMVSLPYVNELN